LCYVFKRVAGVLEVIYAWSLIYLHYLITLQTDMAVMMPPLGGIITDDLLLCRLTVKDKERKKSGQW
jgi:hypothetical protein